VITKSTWRQWFPKRKHHPEDPFRTDPHRFPHQPVDKIDYPSFAGGTRRVLVIRSRQSIAELLRQRVDIHGRLRAPVVLKLIRRINQQTFEVDRERYVILPGKRPQSFVRVLRLAVDADAYLWSESCAPAAAMSPQVSSG
jgi:hypothetical protein